MLLFTALCCVHASDYITPRVETARKSLGSSAGIIIKTTLLLPFLEDFITDVKEKNPASRLTFAKPVIESLDYITQILTWYSRSKTDIPSQPCATFDLNFAVFLGASGIEFGRPRETLWFRPGDLNLIITNGQRTLDAWDLLERELRGCRNYLGALDYWAKNRNVTITNEP